MALGATKENILLLILRQGLVTAAVGIAAGLLASVSLSQTMKSLLFGISASDPLTLAVMVLLLFAVALVACYIPARRATRVDPLEALHYE